MQLLNVQNISKYYGERCLFSDCSFSVETGRRIGVVGANGTGKTTLFHILTGTEDCDSGHVVMSKDTTVGYLEQHVACDVKGSAYDYCMSVFNELTAMENELSEISDKLREKPDEALIARQHELTERFSDCGGLTYKSRVNATLAGLGFSADETLRPVTEFSGGQRSKLGLARLLLSGANLLLLDEPTNHLDIDAVEWLESFLLSYKGAFMVITHDRFFLDKVTDSTLEIENRKITWFGKKYSEYKQVKAQRAESQRREYNETMKEIHRLEGIVEQQRRWNREKNIKTAESKLKVIDKLSQTLEKPPEEEKAVDFSFECEKTGPREVLMAKNLSLSFGQNSLFKNVDIHVFRGEKIFLLGPNGCGKTSLLRLVCGQYEGGGTVRFGAGVRYAYFDQVQSGLDLKKTALDEVWDKNPQMSEPKLRAAFASFLFYGDDVHKRISELSGGERARVQLLELMLSKAELLILDEPTNHLDIASKEAVENALLSFGGTVLAVSHDRYFINKLADRIYVFGKNGAITEHKGSYDDYLDSRDRDAAQTARESTSSLTGADEYRRKKESAAEQRRLKGILERCERTADELANEKRITAKKLSAPENASDYALLSELTEKLAELEKRENETLCAWEEAQQRLENEFPGSE